MEIFNIRGKYKKCEAKRRRKISYCSTAHDYLIANSTMSHQQHWPNPNIANPTFRLVRETDFLSQLKALLHNSLEKVHHSLLQLIINILVIFSVLEFFRQNPFFLMMVRSMKHSQYRMGGL